jgi:hypothetical protein
MSTKSECPICRKPANESNIRPNVALTEAVEAWQSARSILNDFSCASEKS